MQPEASALLRRWSRGRISYDTASHGECIGRSRSRGHSNPAGRPPPLKWPRPSMCSYGCQRGSRAAGLTTCHLKKEVQAPLQDVYAGRGSELQCMLPLRSSC
ncbi:hypothetical protein NDU88_003990 [Pleurodeles waltl]|uniref:Uncharacterized protein n=1 Tax=Pleurodeles waltl TaxID=8319 RepID=A0AAV7WT95_PLEWA|nr:hypothetical protein NDU88_003990 [Pleurodeles waltl]